MAGTQLIRRAGHLFSALLSTVLFASAAHSADTYQVPRLELPALSVGAAESIVRECEEAARTQAAA